MTWEVEVSNEFIDWYESLNEEEWESVNSAVGKLQQFGPTLGRPYVDTLIGSKYPNLKELRCSIKVDRYASFSCLTLAAMPT